MAAPEIAASSRSRRRLGVVFWLSVGWVLLLVALAVLAPILPIRDPDELGIRTREIARYESPGWNAWFGGDEQGRDLFSNVVWAIRPALLIGVIVTAVSAAIGTFVGVVSGYVRGRVDTVSMAMVDTALAFPALIALAALMGTLGNTLWVLILSLSVLGVPPYARIVRGVTLSVAEREFVEAARSMGATRWRIIGREVLPNVMLAVLSFAFLGFAIVIATEGALAFIGLSIDQTTWGVLISEGARAIREASHLALFPATAMFLTILAFNFIGDTMRTLADPRPVATARRRAAEVDPDAPSTSAALLSVRDLRTVLHTELGAVRAVDGVSFDVERGRTLGIVGESGSGKTMLLRSLLGTFPLPSVQRSGRIDFDGDDLLGADDAHRRRVLGTEIGVVFQNPLTALNPVRTIGSQLAEPLQVHHRLSRTAARARALELLDVVHIPEPTKRLRQYPFQLSGGMRQRVTIAIALANGPQLLLADEPTTALDVTVQDQILRLLAELQQSSDMALVLVTHDLAVVKGWTDEVAVMYAGQIVEKAPTEALFDRPMMRYTEALLESIPRLDRPSHDTLAVIEGAPPSLINPPDGCRFAPRCAWAQDRCRTDIPPPVDAGNGHLYACWYPAGHPDARRSDAPVEVHGGR